MNKKLITITGPTCAGKSVLLAQLVKDSQFIHLISTTTRPPRVNEINGVDYYFISVEFFSEMEKNNEFIEWVFFNGNYYGITKSEISNKLSSGKIPCLILEPQGVTKYKKYCKETKLGLLTVFVDVDESTRLERLNARTVKDLQNNVVEKIQAIITTHTNRIISTKNVEQKWRKYNQWDIVVSGYNVHRACEKIKITINSETK